MGFRIADALGVHPDVLHIRAERTKVLASNIANASTPMYQAKDIDFKSALAAMESSDAADGLSLGQSELMYRVPNQPSADGNTVEMGVEQAAFSQNISDFQTSLTFLNMRIRQLSRAIAGQ